MLAFQAGHEEVFAEIVELYETAVFSLLRRLLGPGASLEDLAQEVFLRLYRSRERYRPEGRLGTFLYRITYNLALNHLRDRKRHKTAGMPEHADGEAVELADPKAPAPEAPLDQELWARRIETALAELPENQRLALVLQHYNGLELTEIGDVLGISAKAVKSLLHRARQRMKTLLEPYREAES